MVIIAASPTASGLAEACEFFEVLTSDVTARTYGYRLRGGFSGPTLAVLGHGAGAVAVFDRLKSIDSLRWMHGNLILLRIDASLDVLADIERNGGLGPIDRTMVLPLADVVPALADRWAHTPVLRLCAALGMIDGRGLPPEHDPRTI